MSDALRPWTVKNGTAPRVVSFTVLRRPVEQALSAHAYFHAGKALIPWLYANREDFLFGRALLGLQPKPKMPLSPGQCVKYEAAAAQQLAHLDHVAFVEEIESVSPIQRLAGLPIEERAMVLLGRSPRRIIAARRGTPRPWVPVGATSRNRHRGR